MLHPALVRSRWLGALLGIIVQSVVVTGLIHGALALLEISWPPIYTLGAVMSGFALAEIGFQRRAMAQRAPAMTLAGELFDRLPEAKVTWMHGLPVIRAKREDRWVALHFETVGLSPLRVGVTVAAWAPVPLWMAARLREDSPEKAEERLRVKRKYYEVPFPDGADPRLVGLSPEQGRSEAWLAEDAHASVAQGLLLGNAPCSSTLELFGDSARWDTRLTDSIGADRILSVFDTLLQWLAPIEFVDEATLAAAELAEAEQASEPAC
jgi:hypothetical protein